ncbi:MAG: hypothetical protein V3V75_05490 [Thermoguttaceae bacterium]
MEIVVEAPAKLNLFFEVLAKRNDGYHEIETLMCPVDLYDTVCFTEDPSGQVTLECSSDTEFGDSGSENPDVVSRGVGMGDLPSGRENLVWQAVDLLRRRAGVGGGAHLRLIKRIPAAAGLGGGSSDAAAALLAANEGWSLGWSREELMPIAAELGSDVPFFLVGGPAVCRGRGERVEPAAGLGDLHFVVACPPAGLSTAAVYAACCPADRAREVAPLVSCLQAGNVEEAGRLIFNRLQEVAEALSPWIVRLGGQLEGLDCLGHGMSGSGSSYFGLCRDARHARRITERLGANGVCSVFAVRSCR